MPLNSELTTRPKNVPIDWFDPVYWNTYLTVRERADYIADGIEIALPLPEYCETWEQCARWKNLPKKEFMATFGAAVLAQYDIPTEEELERVQRYADDELDEEEARRVEDETYFSPEGSDEGDDDE
jgi:hypothetical protein